MEDTTVKDLKQQLIDTVSGIDKSKLTIFDLHTLAETVKIISETSDTSTNYLDLLSKTVAGGFGNTKPSTIADLSKEV